jgi:hypothetical protein
MPSPPRAKGLKVGGLTIKVASLGIEDATISYRSGDTFEVAQHVTVKLTGIACRQGSKLNTAKACVGPGAIALAGGKVSRATKAVQ